MAGSNAVCLSNGEVEMRYYQGRAGTGIRVFEARKKMKKIEIFMFGFLDFAKG